jgi:hypothetical protein
MSYWENSKDSMSGRMYNMLLVTRQMHGSPVMMAFECTSIGSGFNGGNGYVTKHLAKVLCSILIEIMRR